MEVTTSERQASGGEAPKLPAENLVKAFYGVVDRLGDDVAIIDEAREKELTWNELRDLMHRYRALPVAEKTRELVVGGRNAWELSHHVADARHF